MEKVLPVLCALALACCLAGCAATDEAPDDGDGTPVHTSETLDAACDEVAFHVIGLEVPSDWTRVVDKSDRVGWACGDTAASLSLRWRAWSDLSTTAAAGEDYVRSTLEHHAARTDVVAGSGRIEELQVDGLPALRGEWQRDKDGVRRWVAKLGIITADGLLSLSFESPVSLLDDLRPRFEHVVESVRADDGAADALRDAIEDGGAHSTSTYHVGDDIEPGEYAVVPDSARTASFSVYADATRSHLLGLRRFEYLAYVTLLDGQLVDVRRATLVPTAEHRVDDVSELVSGAGRGTLRVGTDIRAGTYDLVAYRAKTAYVAVYDSSAPGAKPLSATTFEDRDEVTVEDGQYLELAYCTIAT